jgi:NTE family protein
MTALAVRQAVMGPRAAARTSSPHTAFVLSGGAGLGALQVGMLQALYERGVAPDALVATSAGALNAAFVASRPQTPATAQELGRIWHGLRRKDIFPISMTSLVAGLCGRRDHVVADDALRRLIRRHLDFRDLAEAPIPLHLVAFDLVEGREVLLSDGPALDAIAASASIPGIFPPVAIGEHRLVDGGVANHTPVSHAVELGAQRVYVLTTHASARPPRRMAANALDATFYGLSLLAASRLKADLARYSSEAELIVLSPAGAVRARPTDFDRADELVNAACAAARAQLATRRAGSRLRLAQ